MFFNHLMLSFFKACVHYFLKTHYTSDLITWMKQTMPTCVNIPRKPKLYHTMAHASSTFTA